MFPENVSIPFMGSALSTFQSAPFVNARNGEMVAFSDWGYLVARNLGGHISGIKGWLRNRDLPNFFLHQKEYLTRSHELGENMVRLSLEWGRVCPQPFFVDERYLFDNMKVWAMIRASGAEPFVTLNHFTLPLYLVERDHDGKIVPGGGWEHRDVARHFQFYVDAVAKALSNRDRVREALSGLGLEDGPREQIIEEGLIQWFMTINEPLTVIGNGYLWGSFPPFAKHRYFGYLRGRILRKMVIAHELAFATLKEMGQKMKLPPGRMPRVGVGYNWNLVTGPFAGPWQNLFDLRITKAFEEKGSDYLGLQYYFRKTVPLLDGTCRDWSDHPAFGDIYPEGVANVLHGMHHAFPGKPILTTEIGFSDRGDQRRPFWLLETVRHIMRAKAEGVPVEGILHWSLADNLEWEQGMTQSFGLFKKEEELGAPLVSASQGIRSWEAWQAAVHYARLRIPFEESWSNLLLAYERAKAQYHTAGKRS